jgi:hypothetical protein
LSICHSVPREARTAVTSPPPAGHQRAEIPQADAGEEHHQPAAAEDQERGAEVGLAQHQRGGIRIIATAMKTQNGCEVRRMSSQS